MASIVLVFACIASVCGGLSGADANPAPAAQGHFHNKQQTGFCISDSLSSCEERAAEAEVTQRVSFLHITDIHLALAYREEADVNCSKKPCCRQKSRHTAPGAGPFGEASCESPPALLISALAHTQVLRPDFAILTGDISAHLPPPSLLDKADFLAKQAAGVEQSSWQEWQLQRQRAGVSEALRAAAQLFEEHLPGVPLYAGLGNGDFVPASSDLGSPHHDWLTSQVAELWGDALTDDNLETLISGGFYEAAVAPGLRLLMLNTQDCHVRNFGAFVEAPPPEQSEQLIWLMGALGEARQKKERCIIAGHVPPGLTGGCWGNWSALYERVVAAHADVIVAQVFGHVHHGGFRLLRQKPQSPEQEYEVAHITPALSPLKGGQPSFRIYHLSPTGEELASFQQYYLKLSAANALPSSAEPAWQEGFDPTVWLSAKLGLQNASAASWVALAREMRRNTAVLDEFAAALANGDRSLAKWLPERTDGEDGQKRHEALCAMEHVDERLLLACSRRSEEHLLRQVIGAPTYVLSSFFPFQLISEHFSSLLEHL